jgi:hypothetical protein
MKLYYGERNIHRVLDEIEFWKRQEAEHTVVIRNLDPNLESEFVEELEDLENEFSRVEGVAIRYIELINDAGYNPITYQQVLGLVNFSLCQSQQFIMFLDRLLAESEAIRNNQTAGVVVNHIRRESEYFIGTAQSILENMRKGTY